MNSLLSENRQKILFLIWKFAKYRIDMNRKAKIEILNVIFYAFYYLVMNNLWEKGESKI